MSNLVAVSVLEEIDSPSWIENVEPFIQTVLSDLNYNDEYVSVLFCNNSYMQNLNLQYRKIDSATDVLSFEDGEKFTTEDGEEFTNCGDIAISIEMIAENASYFSTTSNDELKRLLVHGILHLHGMDHGEEHIESGKSPTCEMLVLQEKILLNYANIKVIG